MKQLNISLLLGHTVGAMKLNWSHQQSQGGSIGKSIDDLLSLYYSIVYCYNGAQRFEQFLQVGRLYQASTLRGLALCLPSGSVSLVFTVVRRAHINST